MARVRFDCIALAALLVLPGCAHDKLLRLETAEYALAAKDAQSKGRAFYDGLIRQDREFWIARYQRDPACKPESMSPSYANGNLPGNRICSSDPKSEKDNPLHDLRRTDFASRYAALSFIGHYLDALAKASVDPELGAEEDFTAAVGDLNTLLSAFKEQKIPDTKTAAIGKLVGFMEELSKEHRSAEEIRLIVAERRSGVDDAFRVLVLALKDDKSLEKATSNIILLDRMVIANGASGSEARELRRQVMEQHFLMQDDVQRIEACEKAASTRPDGKLGLSERDLCAIPEAGLMLAAWQSHDAFLDLIDGHLSAKQKARLVRLQRENFMRLAELYLQFAALA
ncbi:MAG: hypothetical protein ACTHOH_09230 [Lysobacteraceae bacterium]